MKNLNFDEFTMVWTSIRLKGSNILRLRDQQRIFIQSDDFSDTFGTYRIVLMIQKHEQSFEISVAIKIIDS